MTDDLYEMPFSVEWHGRQINVSPGIAARPLRPRMLLPIVQNVTNAITTLAEEAVKDAGKAITCRAGCGACCRQLVPVTRSEAWNLREGMNELPEARRAEIQERFATGKRRLAEAGMLEKLERADETTDRLALGREYFKLGIACPFLESECCSIHPDRPLACREYLVTTPAELCRSEHDGEIRKALLPAKPMPAYASLDGEAATGDVHWLPLMLAPDWAEANPEPEPTVPGTELFARFVEVLGRGSAAT